MAVGLRTQQPAAGDRYYASRDQCGVYNRTIKGRKWFLDRHGRDSTDADAFSDDSPTSVASDESDKASPSWPVVGVANRSFAFYKVQATRRI